MPYVWHPFFCFTIGENIPNRNELDVVEDNIGGLNQLYIIYIATIYPTSTLWCIIGVGVSSSQQGGVVVPAGGCWRHNTRV